MADADIPPHEPLSKNIPGDLSYEEQLALVESMMSCYDTPLTQAAGYTRDLLKTVIGLKRSVNSADFQLRVQPWMTECFGSVISGDTIERNHRFLEEALELVQACGCSRDDAMHLVDYVYGRPIGDPPQEVGGVMVTLAALCLARGLNMHAAGETELDRIFQPEIVDKIRLKQATKPKGSPLPQAVPRDEVKFARADIDQLPCVEKGDHFFTALIASVSIDLNGFPLKGNGRRNFNIESYIAPSIQARILHKLGSGPIGGYFVIQDDFNRSRLITWDGTKTVRAPVDLKAGANAVKGVFDLSLVGPDSGFKSEDVAEAVAGAWGLEVRR